MWTSFSADFTSRYFGISGLIYDRESLEGAPELPPQNGSPKGQFAVAVVAE
jgi:hypothetical protein